MSGISMEKIINIIEKQDTIELGPSNKRIKVHGNLLDIEEMEKKLLNGRTLANRYAEVK